MTAAAVCEWTRLAEDDCAHCTPDAPRPAQGTTGTTGLAQDYSRCPACECIVWPGERIVLVDGVWVDAGCMGGAS